MRALVVSDPHCTVTPPPGRTTTPFWGVFVAKVDALLAAHRPDALWILGDLVHTWNVATPLLAPLKAAFGRWGLAVVVVCLLKNWGRQ